MELKDKIKLQPKGIVKILTIEDNNIIGETVFENKVLFLSRYILAKAFNPTNGTFGTIENGKWVEKQSSKSMFDPNRAYGDSNNVSGLLVNMGFLVPNGAMPLNRLIIGDGSLDANEKMKMPNDINNNRLIDTFENDIYGNSIVGDTKTASINATTIETDFNSISCAFDIYDTNFSNSNGGNIVIRQWGLATQDGFIFSKVIFPFIKKNNQSLKVLWKIIF